MTDREFLWCALNLILDDEEELAGLCPGCRDKAMEERCVSCGAPLATWEESVNQGFDRERFERMKRGLRK
ncbi:MAG: molybdopterin oxidoreductase [Ruminococcaceae bacterium]|nr:molybdopterin oxidoreductase [Oscillospiraceae bacterium]